MAVPQIEPEPESEITKETAWRYLIFQGMGFDVVNARLLATAKYVDLAEARHLIVERECPLDVALKILL